MAAIHEHGHIWKDTLPGVWTTVIEPFGQSMVAYAIEVVDDDGEWVAAEAYDDAAHYLERFKGANGNQGGRQPIYLAGKPHMIFAV